MARPKKNANGENSANGDVQSSSLTDKHARLFTEVHHAFSAVQSTFDHLSRAYVDYTRFMNENAQQLGLPPSSANNSLSFFGYGGYSSTQRDSPKPKPEPEPESTEPNKRRPYKKRDPNAPKRPLTAYFLYLNYARPVIKEDLRGQFGRLPRPKQVTEEATARFKALGPEERAAWDAIYIANKEKYEEKVKKYKAGIPITTEDEDEEEGEEEEEEEEEEDGDEVMDDMSLDQDEEVPDESSKQTQEAVATVAGANATGEDSETDSSEEDGDEEEEPKKTVPPPPAKQPSPVKTKVNPPKPSKSQDAPAPKQVAPRPSPSQQNGTAASPKKTPVPLPKAAKQTPVPLPSSDGNKGSKNEPAQNEYNFPIDPEILNEENAKESKRKADTKEQSPELPKKKKVKKVKDGMPRSSSAIEDSSQTVAESTPKPDSQPDVKSDDKPEGKKKKKKRPHSSLHSQLTQAAQA